MSAHPAGPRHADLPAAARPDRPGSAAELAALAPAVWPRGIGRNDDGVVTVRGLPVTDLAAQYGTPVFLVDEADFRSRCQEMAAAFGAAERVHYASKAFLSSEVARWVRDEGLSLDVCSEYELALALRADFPAARITLHGNNKTESELDLAVTSGVGHVVLDSLIEIDRLNRIAQARGVVQDVLVRITVGVEAHTHEFIATAHEDQKFGFSLSDGAAMDAVSAVFAADHLRLVGLHSHIGSQIFEVDGFELAAHRVLGLLRDVIGAYGVDKTAQLSTLDLGGGLGISYVASDDPPPIEEVAAKIRHIVENESALLGLPLPTVVVEPGRAIAGPGTITVYTVGTVKDVRVSADVVRKYVSVDGGMSDNLRTALYQAEYDVRLANRVSEAPAALARVVGKHCESGDIVVRDCWLPADIGPGDLLAVAATGAYCYAMSSRYNLALRPPVVTVTEGAGESASAHVMLRRETLDDIVSLEVNQ